MSESKDLTNFENLVSIANRASPRAQSPEKSSNGQLPLLTIETSNEGVSDGTGSLILPRRQPSIITSAELSPRSARGKKTVKKSPENLKQNDSSTDDDSKVN